VGPQEQASVRTRLVRRLLALPDPVLRKIAGPPVVKDGRTLDLRVQAIVAVGERLRLVGDEFDVAARRKQLADASAVGMPRRTGIHVVDRLVPGPAGEIPVRVYRKFGSAPRPRTVMYLHGGGWVTGDLDSHDGSCRLLADVTGCVVVAVDYRLAPEHPFPAAVDDSLAAYRWIHEHADDLGVEPGKVGVMGDSAGGNLAAVVAQVTRDAQVPAPVAQCLVYPATETRFTAPSHDLFATGFMLTRAGMEWFRSQYLPDPADWDSPLAAPSLTDDLSGLAPAAVFTAGFDPLRDDGRAYADALAKAGVPVQYRCYDDLVHGFFGMGVLPGGMDVATEVCAAMGALMAEG
jgi:acetyl esterase